MKGKKKITMSKIEKNYEEKTERNKGESRFYSKFTGFISYLFLITPIHVAD